MDWEEIYIKQYVENRCWLQNKSFVVKKRSHGQWECFLWEGICTTRWCQMIIQNKLNEWLTILRKKIHFNSCATKIHIARQFSTLVNLIFPFLSFPKVLYVQQYDIPLPTIHISPWTVFHFIANQDWSTSFLFILEWMFSYWQISTFFYEEWLW